MFRDVSKRWSFCRLSPARQHRPSQLPSTVRPCSPSDVIYYRVGCDGPVG